jgi:hypothetical protein
MVMSAIETFHNQFHVCKVKSEETILSSESNYLPMARKRVSENPVIISTGAAAVPARSKLATRKRLSEAARPEQDSNPGEIEVSVLPVEPVAELLVPSSPAVSPDHETARLAYSYWEARGCCGGSPEEDWLRAERELRVKSAR